MRAVFHYSRNSAQRGLQAFSTEILRWLQWLDFCLTVLKPSQWQTFSIWNKLLETLLWQSRNLFWLTPCLIERFWAMAAHLSPWDKWWWVRHSPSEPQWLTTPHTLWMCNLSWWWTLHIPKQCVLGRWSQISKHHDWHLSLTSKAQLGLFGLSSHCP